MWFRWLLMTIFVVVGANCGQLKDTSNLRRRESNDRLNRAIRFSDEGRYDEAFRELDSVDREDPGNRKRYEIRASVHLARAGFRAVDVIAQWNSLERGVREGEGITEDLLTRYEPQLQQASRRLQALGASERDRAEALRVLLKVLGSARAALRYLNQIPPLRPGALEDLSAAEAVLVEAGDELPQSALVYRAMVRALIVRNTLTPQQLDDRRFPVGVLCGIPTHVLAEQVLTIVEAVVGIYQDLRRATPDRVSKNEVLEKAVEAMNRHRVGTAIRDLRQRVRGSEEPLCRL